MILSRSISKRGVFGSLLSDDSKKIICVTLERAYLTIYQGEYEGKVPPGKYVCVKGEHSLPDHKGGFIAFETYEVTGVPGHSGILFHTGNSQKDTDGCILVGQKMNTSYNLVNSKQAFEDFMKYLGGVKEFELKVQGGVW